MAELVEHVDQVLTWMKTARWAASGGNSQPWVVSGRKSGASTLVIDIEVDPEYRKLPSPMDVQGLAMALAFGCLAKNLEFVAANDGYALKKTSFSLGKTHFDGRVQLEFQAEAGVPRRFTNEQIIARRTDRGRYRTDALPASLVANLSLIVANAASSGLLYREFMSSGSARKADLVAPLSEIEHVRWRNRPLLAGLLREVSFGREISREPRKIPVTQLGVNAFDQMFIKMFQKFEFLRPLFKMGFDALPVRRAVYDYCRFSERVCFLQMKLEKNARDFEKAFELGRVYQEIWLDANSHGVSFQPMGLPLIALGYWRHETSLEFTMAHERAIERATAKFEGLGIDLRELVMGFRLGHTKELAEKAPRAEARDLIRPSV